jgi:hypothetical protein
MPPIKKLKKKKEKKEREIGSCPDTVARLYPITTAG